MKNKSFLRLCFASLFSLACLAGCGSGETNYGITILPSENGYVAPNKASAPIGATIVLTAYPDENYRAKSLTINGAPIKEGFDVNNQYTIKMVSGGLVVKADFIRLYNVKFDYPEGQDDINLFVDDGEKIDEPALQPINNDEEMEFVGWSYDFEQPVHSDLLITPVFKQILRNYTIKELREEHLKTLIDQTHVNKYLNKRGVVKGTVVVYTNHFIFVQERTDNEVYGVAGFDGQHDVPSKYTGQNTYLEIPSYFTQYNGMFEITDIVGKFPLYDNMARDDDVKVLLTPEQNIDKRVVKQEQSIKELNDDFANKQAIATKYGCVIDNYIGDSVNTYTFTNKDMTSGLMTIEGLDNVVFYYNDFRNDSLGNPIELNKQYRISGVANYQSDGWTIYPTSNANIVPVE